MTEENVINQTPELSAEEEQIALNEQMLVRRKKFVKILLAS